MALTILQSEVTKTAAPFAGAAIDISTLTKPFSIQVTVDGLDTGATALFELHSSADGFSSDVRTEEVFGFYGPFSKVAPSGRVVHHYDLAGIRAGVTSAHLKLVLAYLDAGALTLGVPGTVTPTPSASGGSLAAATYFYKVTALGNGGETLPSPEATSGLTSGSSSSVALAWAAVPGATSYRIYRGTVTNTETVYYTSGTNSFTDTGASSTNGTPPVANSTGSPSVSYSASIQN